MERVLSALGMASWKTALQRMQAANLTNDSHTDLEQLRQLVVQHVRTPKQLASFLKAARHTASSPLILLKHAILLHLHLQLAPTPSPSTVLEFAAFLVERCEAVVVLWGEGEGDYSKCGVRSQPSTREDEAFLGKEVLLVAKVIRPYLRYQQRLMALLPSVRKLREREVDAALAWQITNLLRGVTAITGQFVMIGRYFMREYGQAVVLLTSALTNDINNCMDAIRKYVLTQNKALCCSMADGMKLHEFVSFLDELAVLNEQLMQVYLGKYFFREMRELKQPEWIYPNSSQFDPIFKLAQTLKHPR